MASIKDLFGKKSSNKIVTNSSVSDIGDPIESANFIKSKVTEIQRYVPNVDFTTASNFAVYGLAEKYYEDSINYIVNEYPYDGSRKERIDWELNGTYLDKYFLENTYPRTNGYVNIGEDYGTLVSSSGFWELRSKVEYIKFFGGPNQEVMIQQKTYQVILKNQMFMRLAQGKMSTLILMATKVLL
jgi:hypothetical protein